MSQTFLKFSSLPLSPSLSLPLLHLHITHFCVKIPPLQVTLVFGQMNEPPSTRARVALTALTVAEYFRDKVSKDVLLFIDT